MARSTRRTSRRARRSSPLNLPGAFELFKPSKDLFLKHIWIFGPLYAVPFIFWIHSWLWTPGVGHHGHMYWNDTWSFTSGSPGNPLPTYSAGIFIGFSLLWLFIIILAGTLVQIMSQAAQLDATDDRHLHFGKLWEQTRPVFWRMLGVYLAIFVVVGIGLILLIVPGVIMMRRYFFAPYILLEKKTTVGEALSESAALSRLNTGSIYGILGVMFLIALLNVIPFVGGLLSFGAGALYSLAPALRYQQLKRIQHLA